MLRKSEPFPISDSLHVVCFSYVDTQRIISCPQGCDASVPILKNHYAGTFTNLLTQIPTAQNITPYLLLPHASAAHRRPVVPGRKSLTYTVIKVVKKLEHNKQQTDGHLMTPPQVTSLSCQKKHLFCHTLNIYITKILKISMFNILIFKALFCLQKFLNINYLN